MNIQSSTQPQDIEDDIYGDSFPLEDDLPIDFQSSPTLGTYQTCCIACGKFWSYFCIGWNVLTCCQFMKPKFFRKLSTYQVGIVEQFGKFTRMLDPGLNLINPCSQESFQIGKQEVLTRDNISLTVQGAVFYRVTNPIKLVYGLGPNQLQQGIQQAACDVIRNSFGQHTLDQILLARNNYIQLTKTHLQQKLTHHGILIEDIFLTELELPESIRENLNVAARQKRMGEARIVMAKARVEAAGLMRESSDIMQGKAVMQIRYLEMLQEFAREGKTMKVVLPIGINSGWKEVNEQQRIKE